MSLSDFFNSLNRYRLEYKSFTILPFSITFSVIDLQDNTEKGFLTITIEQNRLKANMEIQF
jgi:hypothetical protein